MVKFKTISFIETEGNVKVTLLNLFKTVIPKDEVNFVIHDLNTINFNNVKDEERFFFKLDKYFDNLTNKLTGNKVTYIHKNSGIPLIGNVAFGIVNRGSSIIEIKPVTSCNLDCVYCSISEGLSSKKNDFVVEKDYLVEELQKVLNEIDETVEIHIGVQGEPFLYADIYDLINDLQLMDKIHTISIDTNGTLLSKLKIDSLADNDKGKLQLNLSLDAMDSEVAKKIAGVQNYNVEHVKEIIAYASAKLNVILAPVFTEGYNNEEMVKIIEWVNSLDKKPTIGIQNFLRYKTGRNPGKEISWHDFYQMLEDLEKKYGVKLKLNKNDFNIKKIQKFEKPFKEGDIIDAIIKCEDRFKNSVIAVSKNRNISVPNCEFKRNKHIKVKITRDKHNVFTGRLV